MAAKKKAATTRVTKKATARKTPYDTSGAGTTKVKATKSTARTYGSASKRKSK